MSTASIPVTWLAKLIIPTVEAIGLNTKYIFIFLNFTTHSTKWEESGEVICNTYTSEN
jgi:hypothetical protein